MVDNRINSSNFKPINFDSLNLTFQTSNPGSATPSFKDLIAKAIDEVNKLQLEADTAMKEFAKTGSAEKLPEVITKIKQAEIAFDLLLQIRNKVIDAYNDIQRMPL